MTGRRNARRANSRNTFCRGRSRVARRDRERRGAATVSLAAGSISLTGRSPNKRPTLGGGQLVEQGAFDLDPLDGDPSAGIRFGADSPKAAAPALIVVVRVERTEIE